jgi:two-component system alkaline phosphatase synthesis response regulator PhoP
MSKTDTAAKTILVFDDDPDYLLQTRLRLEAAGYKVVESETSTNAEQLIDEVAPDLVVADLMMEQSDSGFTLCHTLKKSTPDLPIVMVTGVASETGMEFDATTEEERSWLKADVVLEKPIRFEQLQREIERLLGE